MFFAFWQFLLIHSKISFFIFTFLVIVLDGIDGIVARALKQESPLGAKIDIYCDRVVELAYWYFFAFISYIDIWVFWFFLVRGFIVDFLSSKNQKPLGDSFLRSSRFMRFSYGFLKFASFALLILAPNLSFFDFNITLIVVYLTVFVCLLRAIPVLQSLYGNRH